MMVLSHISSDTRHELRNQTARYCILHLCVRGVRGSRAQPVSTSPVSPLENSMNHTVIVAMLNLTELQANKRGVVTLTPLLY